MSERLDTEARRLHKARDARQESIERKALPLRSDARDSDTCCREEEVGSGKLCRARTGMLRPGPDGEKRLAREGRVNAQPKQPEAAWTL